MAQSREHRAFRSRVVKGIVPRAISLFLRKNEGYPYETSEFGAKAEVVELHRKYKKLKHHIWDEQPLNGEGPVEIAMDMIGHCILLIDALELNSMQDEALPEFDSEHWLILYQDAMEDIDTIAEEIGG